MLREYRHFFHILFEYKFIHKLKINIKKFNVSKIRDWIFEEYVEALIMFE